MIDYIIKNLITQKQLYKYRRTFFHLNETADGDLSRKDLLHCFWDFKMQNVDQNKIDEVLVIIDVDNNGSINFEEFLMTAIT